MTSTAGRDLSVRVLQDGDLGVADHICRVAFGTFLGLDDPASFMGDAGYVRTRWRSNPASSLAAERDGELVGSNFATRWGSFGFFGPLSVRPDLWGAGVGQRLLESTMLLFDQWRTTHEGLFTFGQSPKHVHLYQKYGFWPRYLTAIMAKPVEGGAKHADWTTLSSYSELQQQDLIGSCSQLTDSVYSGLDLTAEIEAVRRQRLGDTVLLLSGSTVDAFAVCHVGSGTEAGGDTCYVKFGVSDARHGAGGFERLLSAIEDFAATQRIHTLSAGINTARHLAYRSMLSHGFRTQLQGVAMQRPNEPGFNKPEVWIMDDWR